MTVDGGGVFPLGYRAHELTTLALQAKNDRHGIPPRWYWRYLGIDDDDGASPYDAFDEESFIDSRYDQPVAAYIYLDPKGLKKEREKGITETSGVIPIEISRAECRRLGGIYHKRDDREALFEEGQPLIDEGAGMDAPWDRPNFIFIPRASDIFLFRDVFYIVQQMEVKSYIANTDIPDVWEGTAAPFAGDSSVPIECDDRFKPPAPRPLDPTPYYRPDAGRVIDGC